MSPLLAAQASPLPAPLTAWDWLGLAFWLVGWWTFYAPSLMTFLLLRVSGVSLLEKTLEARPAYWEYIRRTSAFIPWFPRGDGS